MNLLYDLIYFDKEEQGGISRMWLEYFKLISYSSINPSFLVSQESNNITKDYLLENSFFNSSVIYDKISSRSKFSKNLSKLGFFRNFMLPMSISSNIQIFHSTDYINPIYKPKNIKIVTTIHDMVFWDQKEQFSKGISYWDKIWSIYHSLKISDKIITVSESSKKSIIKYFPWAEKKIIVNYHGLHEDYRNLNIKFNKENYFMFMGGRNKYKNYNLLLEAFSLVHKEFPDWKLIVVGENQNTYLKEQERYKSLGISESVIDYGLVSEEKLIELLQDASALVIPSLNEGFNFPLLEALAVGCPVLSSDIPVSKEIGNYHAVYFSNNTKSLLKCMRNNILYQLKKEDLIKGQEYARTFSWEKSFSNLVNVYESCLR